MSSDHRFQAAVQENLEPHTNALIDVLRQLVEHPYPSEVVALDFEVFADSFSRGFPVRAFFLDDTNSEFFVDIDGEPSYPSPVDPELLHIEHVYPRQFEKDFRTEDPELDVYTLAAEALIHWFARCWNAAGGREFVRRSSIMVHDDARSFDLVNGAWRNL